MPIAQTTSRSVLLAVAMIVLVAGTAPLDRPARAQSSGISAKVGVLRCDVGGGWGLIFGSSKNLRCIYTPDYGTTAERYTGSIEKYGIDIGYSRSATILWAVVAARQGLKYGELAGRYVGATAEATAGAGAGANVLVGSDKTVVLQPISISGQQGLNVAGGIGVMTLKAAK